jgi:membrane-associated phospholipid phosphatase
LIDNGTWNLVEGIELHIKYSFPSGHTASAFCILISMCFLLNNNFYSFLMVGVAFIIGFSRIYLSQHFLIDVIIGAIIGSLIPFFTHIYIQPIISRNILKRKIE